MLDWKKPFINEIYTVEENKKCNDDDEPIFASIWFGMEHMCVHEKGKLFKEDEIWASKGATCKAKRRGPLCNNEDNHDEYSTYHC